MKKEDYLGSIIVRNKLVNIGIDDYGQCYCFEYVKDGQLQERGCGTYNFNFIEEVLYFLDPKGYTISDQGEQAWEQRMLDRKSRGLENLDYDDYQLYDIEKLYETLDIKR